MPKKRRFHRQLTLDNLPKLPKEEPAKISQKVQKQIFITEISTLTKEDEIEIKVAFKLYPSKTSFSKVKLDLSFDNQQISSASVMVPHGALTTDEFELTPVLDMKGIPAGLHTIRVDMFELWGSDEKLYLATRALTVNYVPQTRESRLVKVPFVKCVTGTGLVVVSESEKGIFSEIEKTAKNEYLSSRDKW
jgi:hypothetical protein